MEYIDTIVQLTEKLHLKNLAEEWWRKSLEVRKSALDDQDPELLETYFYYSRALWKTGKFDAAEAAIRKALDLSQHVTERSSLSSGVLFNQLANIECDVGKYDLARQHFETALSLLREQSPPNPVHLIDASIDFAIFLDDKGEFKKAIDLLHTAEQICKKLSFQDQEMALAKVYQYLGRQLWHSPRFRESEHYLRNALDTYYRRLDDKDPRIASCLIDLSIFVESFRRYSRESQTNTASVLWRLGFKAQQEVFGENSLESAFCLETISQHTSKGSSFSLIKRVYDKYRTYWPEDHPKITQLLALIQVGYPDIHESGLSDTSLIEKEETIRKTLINHKKHRTPHHWKLGLTKVCLGVNLVKQNRDREGLLHIDEGLEILMGDCSGSPLRNSLTTLLRRLAIVLNDKGCADEAKSYQDRADIYKCAWPYGKIIKDCDWTWEKKSAIDFEDDQMEKMIEINEDLTAFSKAYLWVYAQLFNLMWRDFHPSDNDRIRVNGDPQKEIAYNCARKFLYITIEPQWVPFEIPMEWLVQGSNRFTFYTEHDENYKKTYSWEYNNLFFFIDNHSNYNRSWWYGNGDYCCYEMVKKTMRAEKPLFRNSAIITDHREQGYEECKGELMMFLELH